MEFSYYMRLDYQRSDIKYMIAGKNKTLYLTRNYQCAIHYMTNVFGSTGHYQVTLDGNQTIYDGALLTSYLYYLSFTSAQSCTQKLKYVFGIMVRGKSYRMNRRREIKIVSLLLIEHQNIYFKTTYHHMRIHANGPPPCDIVLNFQLVIGKDSNKTQGICNNSYTKVSFLNYP